MKATTSITTPALAPDARPVTAATVTADYNAFLSAGCRGSFESFLLNAHVAACAERDALRTEVATMSAHAAA